LKIWLKYIIKNYKNHNLNGYLIFNWSFPDHVTVLFKKDEGVQCLVPISSMNYSIYYQHVQHTIVLIVLYANKIVFYKIALNIYFFTVI
jgi:hypothetical protein